MTTIALIIAIWFTASLPIAVVVGRLLRDPSSDDRPLETPVRFEPRRAQVATAAEVTPNSDATSLRVIRSSPAAGPG